ncbi:MAG TPA: zf-TFIIB domain-containing protein [Polyangiaceae bacterium]|nr:zf-TFIIB domain-containing protein [Polyangiaceae bacterium]
MATSEQCPTCGGPLPAGSGDETVCSFCGARVSRKPPAPKVVERVVERVVIVERGEGPTGRSSLVCPRCSEALFEGKAQDTELFGCGKCGGVWLDNLGSQRLVNALDQGVLAMGDRAAAVGTAQTNTSASAACPVCREALARKTFSGVEIDVCTAHGTWFDRGEMRRVANEVQSARIAAAAGPTHDYEADVRAQGDAATYARGAVAVMGLLLEVAAAAATSK